MSKGSGDRPLVALGQVVGVHGLRGGLKIGGRPGAGVSDPEIFTALEEVEIGGVAYRVQAVVRKKRQILLCLQGVETRQTAEPLVGQDVWGRQDRFPELPEGEYYWFQVLGLPVLHASTGEHLGVLEQIIPAAGHDVYVVRQGGREVLLPAVEEVITEVNLEEGWIKVLPLPGLLETYAD